MALNKNNSNRIQRTNTDLLNHLMAQFRLLKKSTVDFENGDSDEILRMALHLRILASDSEHGKGNSLLSLTMPNFEVLDTCPIIDLHEGIMFYMGGMVSLDIGSTPLRWLLNKDENPRWRPYKEWWEACILCLGNKKFTRKWFIKEMTDTDGGAHVDKKLKKIYYTLKHQGYMGFEIARGGQISEETIPSPINLIIKQIANEMLVSLEKNLKEDLDS
ncbi:MAG TPA: hypothetical protein VIH86_05625 [Puia sp.]